MAIEKAVSRRHRLDLIGKLTEHYVQRADYGDHVTELVFDRHSLDAGQMREAGRLDLTSVRPRRTVRDEVNAELAFRSLDRCDSGSVE